MSLSKLNTKSDLFPAKRSILSAFRENVSELFISSGFSPVQEKVPINCIVPFSILIDLLYKDYHLSTIVEFEYFFMEPN